MIQIPCTIQKVETLSDGSIKLVVYTQEMERPDMAEVMQMARKLGWMVFKEAPIVEKDIPQEEVEYKGDKTPGQRLRGVIYRFWENNTGKTETFEEFYRKQMEKFINLVKDKLP